jgi:dihydrolipoamide dehydrogenase
VVLVERFPSLGGVCLNVGCIPSKALLHTARLITEAEEMAEHGVSFAKPKVDLAKLREWKAKDVVGKLTGGLEPARQAAQGHRGPRRGQFTGPNSLEVAGPDGAAPRPSASITPSSPPARRPSNCPSSRTTRAS